jgi:hypothetical protein
LEESNVLCVLGEDNDGWGDGKVDPSWSLLSVATSFLGVVRLGTSGCRTAIIR